jgi:hypothetical protein
MSTARAIAGGLLAGLGEGIERQGARRSEIAEQMRREALEEARRMQDRTWEKEDQKTLIEDTFTTRDGGVSGITATGATRDLGIDVPLEAGMTGYENPDGAAGGADGTGDDYGTTETNAIRALADRYFSRMDPSGNFIVPEDRREKFTEAVARTERLMIEKGLPMAEAFSIAAPSVLDAITEEDARKLAEEQAKAEDVPRGGLFSAPNRNSWVDERTQQIIEESQSASRRYEQMFAGGDDARASVGEKNEQGQPPGGGTQSDPYRASTQADVDWFRNSAPAGTIIEINGELYQK